jgi:hypothetical protein
MIKFILKNWIEIITAVGILYGIVLSTYNFIDGRKTKKRRLAVKISGGWLTYGPGALSDDMVLIDVTNPGDRMVTVNAPYLKLPGKKTMITPIPTASVTFPHELVEGKNCLLWMKRAEVESELKKIGYSGKVRVRGAVHDATGRVYTSKKAWTFKLDKK